jgi:flagellar assembly protein FliH
MTTSYRNPLRDKPGPAGYSPLSLPDLRSHSAGGASPGPTAEEIAYERGLSDGRLQATHEADRTLHQAIEALKEATRRADDYRKQLSAHFAEHLQVLAVAVARQIIGREVALDPSLIASLVKRALEHVPFDDAIKVRLHPEDLALLDTGTLVEPGRGRTQWIGDPEVGRGGCVIEGPTRLIDGRIDRALLAIFERVTNG